MHYKELCLKTIEIAKEAGRFIVDEQKKFNQSDIETKGLHDFVTYVDRQSENMIISKLAELLPNSSFLAEESQKETDVSKGYTWIIDPLDGTTNFIHNIPLFSVSIGLVFNGNIVLGVIYEPNCDECFYAWQGGGAWLNDSKISVSKTENLSDSLLATGFPYYDYKHLDGYMEFLKYTIKETRGLRRLGSAAVDMAWVACGRFDAFYEYGLRAWDVAAGACIVKEAGGEVTDFKNNNNFLFGKEIIASNNFIKNKLVEQINIFLK